MSISETLAQKLGELPEGTFRLIDNMIVVGENTWASASTYITTIHPKRLSESASAIRAMLEVLNLLRSESAEPVPA